MTLYIFWGTNMQDFRKVMFNDFITKININRFRFSVALCHSGVAASFRGKYIKNVANKTKSICVAKH